MNKMMITANLLLVLLCSCTGSKPEKSSVATEPGFDTAHVEVKPRPSQQDLRVKLSVEYSWHLFENTKDSMVEFYSHSGKPLRQVVYGKDKKVKMERKYSYSDQDKLLAEDEWQGGKLLYKRVYIRKDTAVVQEYFISMQDKDTISWKKLEYNQQGQLGKIIEFDMTTEYRYHPNGLVDRELFYRADTLAGSNIYQYNRKGWLRQKILHMDRTEFGSEKYIYNEDGSLQSKGSGYAGALGSFDTDVYYNYEKNGLVKRIGTSPGDIEYIHYFSKN